MKTLNELTKRVDSLTPAQQAEHQSLKEDLAAMNAIIMDVWPSFNADNPDLLTPAGVARVFADPRYREIERRIFALKTEGRNP